MMNAVTHDQVLQQARTVGSDDWKEAILNHINNHDYSLALVVCGEAILDTLRRETDLSVPELKARMKDCSALEKLEKLLSKLVRQQKQAMRQTSSVQSGLLPSPPPSSDYDPRGMMK